MAYEPLCLIAPALPARASSRRQVGWLSDMHDDDKDDDDHDHDYDNNDDDDDDDDE